MPVLEDDYALDTPSNELQLSRSTVDRCFDFIVSELKEAQNAGLLEDASSGPQRGRLRCFCRRARPGRQDGVPAAPRRSPWRSEGAVPGTLPAVRPCQRGE